MCRNSTWVDKGSVWSREYPKLWPQKTTHDLTKHPIWVQIQVNCIQFSIWDIGKLNVWIFLSSKFGNSIAATPHFKNVLGMFVHSQANQCGMTGRGLVLWWISLPAPKKTCFQAPHHLSLLPCFYHVLSTSFYFYFCYSESRNFNS